jgi:hypothetical protein
MFPYYNNEILHLQYKTIEHLNENIIFEDNDRKRKRFNVFIENLIQKNNDLLEKIRNQEEEDNNINNYEKVTCNDVQMNQCEDDVEQEDIESDTSNNMTDDASSDTEDKKNQ